MNIAQIVSSFAGASRFPGLPAAWHWEAAKGRFHSVLALTGDGQHALQTNARESFDADLVRALIAFALAHEREILAAPTLAVLPGFSAPGFSFDAVAAAAPAVNRMHKADFPELGVVTLAVFPAYGCEFSGRETPEELRYRYYKPLDTANLRREPCPVMRMRYENPRTRGQSIGPKRGLDLPRVLLSGLTKLVDAPGAFVEFENYLGEVRRATWEHDGGLTLWHGDQPPQPVALPDLLAWTEHFLSHGTEEARAPGFRPAEYPPPEWLDIPVLLAFRQGRNPMQPANTAPPPTGTWNWRAARRLSRPPGRRWTARCARWAPPAAGLRS